MARRKKQDAPPSCESNGHAVSVCEILQDQAEKAARYGDSLPPDLEAARVCMTSGGESDVTSITYFDRAGIEQTLAPVPRKTLKVAIVGKAPASQQLAPYGDESWEIWSLSDAPKEIPRWSRHFELHDIEGNTAGDPRTRKDKWGPY